MKKLLILPWCLLLAATASLITSCGSRTKEVYIETDMPLTATAVWAADAKFTDAPEGKTCSGIEIKALKLRDREIPLSSTAVTSDCLIQTKNYGAIQYNAGAGFGQRSFSLTAQQLEQFRKLLSD